jgi:hypothetical protein
MSAVTNLDVARTFPATGRPLHGFTETVSEKLPGLDFG